MKNMLMKIYTFFAALLVRAIVKYCTARGRYVDYVHATGNHLVTVDVSPGFGLGRAVADSVPETRVYMRRYVITGFMTGDAHPNTLTPPGRTFWLRRIWNEARRWFALNRWHLYLHHMHAPDADPCLHDHPWPWGLSWVLLGGYREERFTNTLGEELSRTTYGQGETRMRSYHAPALNRLRGTTFHRISELAHGPARPYKWRAPWNHEGGTWTLFLAGPRRASKPWGYLVPGRGFVPQRERHVEMGASERRAGQ